MKGINKNLIDHFRQNQIVWRNQAPLNEAQVVRNIGFLIEKENKITKTLRKIADNKSLKHFKITNIRNGKV